MTLKRRDLLAGGLSLAASRALAQPAPGVVRVRLETGEGAVVLDAFGDKAPITVANFLRYVDQRRYDGARVYRALRADGAPEYGLVQGGLNSDPARKLKPIGHESTTQTGLSHKDGTVSLARWAPGSATSEFFVCVGDATYLDADPNAPGDNLGFAAFGQVVEGMEVVRRILALPTSPTAGGPDMKGQMLAKPVPILTARRV